MTQQPSSTGGPKRRLTRRDFVKSSTLALAAPMAAGVHAGGSDAIRVGLVGCGGRGAGAAANALEASPRVRLVALADLFADRLASCRDRLAAMSERAVIDAYLECDAFG